jgi:hypothetical protein
MPKCGDKATLRWEVEAPLVGKTGIVMIMRTPDMRISALHTFKIPATKEQEIRWPDQEDPDSPGKHFGGRKVDFIGLNSKTYQDRMADQQYFLNFEVAGKSKRSGDTKIEGYPDKGAIKVNDGIPYEVVMGPRPSWFRRVFKKETNIIPPRTKFTNCGIYELELKDGVVWVILKAEFNMSFAFIQACLNAGVNPEKEIREKILDFWNGPRGFGGWAFHRKDCVRKKHCACAVTFSINGNKFLTGCCKIPLRVRFEQGSDIKVKIVDSNWITQQQAAGSGAVADTGHFPHPEYSPDCYAHEAGHFFGFPDQYGEAGGATATDKSKWPIDNPGVMGPATGANKVSRPIHMEHFMQRVRGLLGDSIEVIRA